MPNMAATLFAPVALDPDRSFMRRTAVGAVNPDVAVTVPAVVARNPHVTRTRRGNYLNRAGRRWANADDDLGVGNPDREDKCRYSDEEIALQVQEGASQVLKT